MLHLTKIIFPLLTTAFWLTAAASNAQKPLTAQQRSISAQTASTRLASGTQITLNNRSVAAAWSQQLNPATGKVRIAIADTGLMQLLGVDLLNTQNATKQPVQWFSQSSPLVLDAWHSGGYRYLDITQLATQAKWQLEVNGNTLRINSPPATVKAIRQGVQPWGARIVVDLDRPTFWQTQQQLITPKPKPELTDDIQLVKQEIAIAIDAANSSPVTQLNTTSPAKDTSHSLFQVATTTPNLTNIRFSVPSGLSARVSTLANPYRLVIDFRPDAMLERDIFWASGLHWRQRFVNIGDARFPVVWLEINPRTVGITLKPILSETTTLVGTTPLIKTAERFSAAAAINGGFFNRKNRLPLGAIRRDGRWLSSPILNRGAIAWNNSGQVKFGRLRLQETITTSTGTRLPVTTFNSGYVQSGIARYNNIWGFAYTPLIDNETIVVVQNNQVTAQLPAGITGKTSFPIPTNGYLLALRNSNAAALLPVGTILKLESTTQPAAFASYPHILAAGPLLIQNRQVVVDAKAEGFSDAFANQTAVRSAIGTTTGNLLIAAVHNRVGGVGPSLTELAKIMQQLGCNDALNLDGGSSTSLYLGGQLLDRSPRTAARVHNGLGIFFTDKTQD